MRADRQQLPACRWTATRLRQLPPEQRQAILRAAAVLAELTAFEAFGDDDFMCGLRAVGRKPPPHMPGRPVR